MPDRLHGIIVLTIAGFASVVILTLSLIATQTLAIQLAALTLIAEGLGFGGLIMVEVLTFFFKRREDEQARPKFRLRGKLSKLQVPLILTTQGRRIDTLVNVVGAALLNVGYQTARDAMPHLGIEGDDEMGKPPICWVEDIDKERPVVIETDEYVRNDPDEIAAISLEELFCEQARYRKGRDH
jgi:hypothetical protein